MDNQKYDWKAIAEYLATEVMGWDRVDKCKGRFYPWRCVFEPHYWKPDKEEGIDQADWNPQDDLNQAKMLAKACEDKKHSTKWDEFKLTFNFEKQKSQARFYRTGHAGSAGVKQKHNEPAKAICLAVVKATETDLEEFEV